MPSLGDPLRLTETLALRNRLVATAHGSGAVADGVPQAGDAEYWERIAAGGVGMVIGGGAVVAPASTIRRGNFIALWRPPTLTRLMSRRATSGNSPHGPPQPNSSTRIVSLHFSRTTIGSF